MTQLTILTPFKQLIDYVKERLNNYNDNLRNELFEKEPNEDNEEAYKRGETIFDKIMESVMRNEIVGKMENIVENVLIEFTNKMKELKEKYGITCYEFM